MAISPSEVRRRLRAGGLVGRLPDKAAILSPCCGHGMLFFHALRTRARARPPPLHPLQRHCLPFDFVVSRLAMLLDTNCQSHCRNCRNGRSLPPIWKILPEPHKDTEQCNPQCKPDESECRGTSGL